MLSDYKSAIEELLQKSEEYKKHVDLEKQNNHIAELEELTKDPDFWNDQNAASSTLKKISDIKKRVEPWEDFFQNLSDLETLYQMAVEEKADEYEDEISETVKALNEQVDKLELLELLSGENDSCNAILNIHPGAGGTEAMDWASMLYRMFTRWAENRGYNIEILDWLDGEEAGIKNVTILIKGDNAYGFLKYESGIHRLVRISPFDSNARRHTSFASVYVTPDIEDEIEIDIKPEDLRVDTYRASGAGGQHVNKTDSAVRMTHLPTNIVVQCQSDRSQHKNRANAMKMLKAKLYEYYKKIKEEEQEKASPEKMDIAWGSQIRSYVFHPYTMAKDHRTKTESGNIQAVMDGDIDTFLDAELKMFTKKVKN